MTKMAEIQTNFASGELDPGLYGQVGLRAYENGAKRVRNCQHRATGGLERRFGTYDLEAISARARMAEFEFSNTQRYVLAFSNLKLEIFDLNGVLLQTIVTTYTEAQCFELTYSQQGDVMVITHIDVDTQVLKRTGATTFTLSDFAFDSSIDNVKVFQPYFKFEAPEVTLTVDGASGSVGIVSSAALFEAGHVGTRFRVYDAEIEIDSVTDSTNAVGTVYGEFEGRLDIDPFKTERGSLDIEVLHLFHGLATSQSVSFSGSTTVGSIPGDEFDGAKTITVLDQNRYKFTLAALSYDIREDLNQDGADETNTYTAAQYSEDGGGPNVRFSVVDAATRNWLEPSFSPVRGAPGATAFHEGRLWLGGTESQPDGIWGSSIISRFNFDVGKGYDGDSVQAAADSEDASRILHIVSNGDLIIFTATREAAFIIRDGEPITPNNARVKVQSDEGCNYVQPVVMDSAVLFVQEEGLQVSELTFSGEEGGYTPTAISTLAGHLIRTPVSMGAAQQIKNRAESQALVVNSDGTAAVFHSIRKEQIAGWGLWSLGAGDIQSVCCVGPYTFFCVEVRGAFRLYRLSDNDLACLDGQVVHTGAASTTWTLDARVRNREVAIVTELGFHGLFDIPADGSLELAVPVGNVVAGDPFYYEIETLPPAVQIPSGTRVGSRQRIAEAIIQFSDTYSATINGRRIETRRTGTDFAALITPLNGYYRSTNLGFSRNPTLVISQDEPLPARVLNIVMKVKI